MAPTQQFSVGELIVGKEITIDCCLMLQSIQLVCDKVQAVILGRHYRTRPRVGPVQRKAQQVFCNNTLRHIKHPIISLEATEELQTDPLASKGSGRNGSYWRGKGGEGSVCSK